MNVKSVDAPFKIYWDHKASFKCKRCGQKYYWTHAQYHRSKSPQSFGMQILIIRCIMPFKGEPCGRVHIKPFTNENIKREENQ